MAHKFTPLSSVPHLMDYWDFEKNSGNVEEISAASKKIFHWKCKICGYT